MTATPTTPVLFLDVDGPLNPFAAKAFRRPHGYATHRLTPPSYVAAQQLRLAALGTPYKRPKPLRVWLNPAHGPRLSRLPFTLVWATSWAEEANEYIGPRIGLPELPTVTWPQDRTSWDGVHWKTRSLAEWADGRPFAWVDDEAGEHDRRWLATHHPGPALVHRVDPRRGLQDTDFATLTAWAEALPGADGAPTDRPGPA